MGTSNQITALNWMIAVMKDRFGKQILLSGLAQVEIISGLAQFC